MGTQYIYIYIIPTPWGRVIFEKLNGSQLAKKVPAFYGTRRFITALKSAYTVRYARTNIIGSRTSFVIASVLHLGVIRSRPTA
jgi:hypothetical protein